MNETVLVNDSADRPSFFGELVVLFRYRRLLGELVMRDLRVRYKRSMLGFVWTMLSPLLTMAILQFVFTETFRATIPRYPVYVLAGLLFWGFFAQSSTQAMNAFLGHHGLLKIVYMPRAIYSFAVIGSGIVHLLLAVVPLLAIMIASGHPLTLSLLFLPISMLVAAVFTLGLGLLLSTLAVFFGDIVTMFQILLVAWFYATPIIYTAEILPPDRRHWLLANPLYAIHSLFLEPIYAGRWPSLSTILEGSGIAILAFCIGWLVFLRYSDRLVYDV